MQIVKFPIVSVFFWLVLEMVSEYLDAEVKDGKAFTDEMPELRSLRNALLEQKRFNCTLKEQLKRAIEIQLRLEMALNEMERQLQQQCEEVSEINKRMFSKNVGTGHVATTKSTTINNLHEHARRRQTCDEKKNGYGVVISSDDKQQPELPDSSCLKPTVDHTKQVEISSWKKQIGRERAIPIKEMLASLNQLFRHIHVIRGAITQSDSGQYHQLEGVLPLCPKSKQSELLQKEKMHSCPHCGKRFQKKCILIRHLRIHDGRNRVPNANKLFKCPTCKTFISKSNLARHKKINSGEKPFICEECSAAFSRKDNLTIHQKVHFGDKPFKCAICKAAFSEKIALSGHQIKVHSVEKPFKSSVCNAAAFSYKKCFTKHQRNHSVDKSFKCLICNAAFTDKSDLTRHKAIHSVDKPFQCSICNTAFISKSNLARHEKIHSGEKPFICEECSAAFGRKDMLKMHRRVHSHK